MKFRHFLLTPPLLQTDLYALGVTQQSHHPAHDIEGEWRLVGRSRLLIVRQSSSSSFLSAVPSYLIC